MACRIGSNAFLSIGLILLSSSFALGQQTPPKSQDAAKVLGEIRQTLATATDLSEDERVWLTSDLADLYLANQQTEDAISLAEDNEGKLKQRIFLQVFEAAADEAIATFASKALDEDAQRDLQQRLTKLAQQADPFRVLDGYQRVKKLFPILGARSSFEFITSIQADLGEFVYRSGGINGQLRKYEHLATIGADLVQANQFEMLEELIDQFGIEETQDHFRKEIVERFVFTRKNNLSAIKDLAESIKSPNPRYWAAFRLGIHFCKSGDLENAQAHVDVISKIFDQVDPRSRRYFADLLVWVGRLQLENGLSAQDSFARAVEITKDKKIPHWIAGVYALAGDFDTALADESAAYFAIKELLDIENKSYEWYRPLEGKPEIERFTAALELANRLKNPHLKAPALCQVSKAIQDLDPPRALALIDEANSTALSSDEVTVIADIRDPVNSSWAIEYVAQQYAELGFPLKALEAASNVSLDKTGVRNMVDNSEYTRRDLVVMRIAQSSSKVDRPFLQDDGKEIFDAIVELSKHSRPKLSLNPECFVGRFAELGLWPEAEKAFQLVRDSFAAAPDLSDSICKLLAKEQDLDRLRHWCSLYRDSFRKYFISHFCGSFDKENITPRLDTVLAVKELAGSDLSYSNIFPFVVTGLWANGNKENALEVLRQGDIEPRGQAAADEIIRWALKHNEPALALELIPRITKRPFELSAYSWYAALMASNDTDFATLNAWTPSQSSAVLVTVKLGIARRHLAVKFDELHGDYPRH